jgi:hypothetical protein
MEFSGSALVCNWVHAGGTASLTGDHRTVSITPTIGLAKRTAGSDADEGYLVTVKDATISWAGVVQAGGTTLEDALIEGKSGTLIVGPEGTASGKRKYTIPAISMGPKMNFPFDNVVEMTLDFQKDGALTRGTY